MNTVAMTITSSTPDPKKYKLIQKVLQKGLRKDSTKILNDRLTAYFFATQSIDPHTFMPNIKDALDITQKTIEYSLISNN